MCRSDSSPDHHLLALNLATAAEVVASWVAFMLCFHTSLYDRFAVHLYWLSFC